MVASERRVLDALPIAVLTLDLEGTITGVNRPWPKRRGPDRAGRADASQGVGAACERRLYEAIAGEAAKEQIEGAMAALRAGRSEVVSWEFSCGSASDEVVLLVQLAPLREGHTVIGYVCSATDITQSHRSREALIEVGTALAPVIELDRLCQEVAQQIRRAVPHDGVVIALADGSGGELRVRYRTDLEETEGELEERLRPRWREAVASGRVLLHRLPAGVELTAPLRSAGGTLGAMTVRTEAVDPPQRLDELERALAVIAAQAAAAVDRAGLVRRAEERQRLRATREAAAGIANELRNPLFGVSSAAQLLRFRAREDPVLERNVGRILREVERLNAMVTDLLEYGSPRALSLAPADPDAVWDEVLEGNRGVLESRSLTLKRTRAKPPVKLPLDAAQLAQAFLNVLTSAAEAAPPVSELALRSAAVPGGGWRCTLHNTGAAIPPDVLPHVFELFSSAKPGGTGVGLALSQRIIDDHHGTISVDSTANRGTTLTIMLPG
jgi:signal transduction histidine kinase